MFHLWTALSHENSGYEGHSDYSFIEKYLTGLMSQNTDDSVFLQKICHV